jgi:superfamily I DNA/RNA helicase
VSGWLVPRSDLTPEQLRAIELPPTEHRVVIGGPGSGKTQLLLHRARHLLDRLGTSPSRYRILVFTNVLKAYIASGLDLLDIPHAQVATFDSWCMRLHGSLKIGRRPWNEEAEQPDFQAIREEVAHAVRAHPPDPKPFDFVLVDEGQDLDPTCFDILRAVAGHVTVCMDRKQQIYEAGSDERQVLATLGARRASVALLETFRCCPHVVTLAASLLDDEADREAYRRQNRIEQTERLTPLLRICDDPEQETRETIEVVRSRIARGERVGVLLPRKQLALSFAKALRVAGIDVEDPARADFSTDRPKVMAYHSAKGLTFDTVVLPRLVEASFERIGVARMRPVLFVGVTRALRWVYLSTTDAAFPLVSWLEPLAAAGAVTIQRGASVASAPATGPTKPSTPMDDVLGLM